MDTALGLPREITAALAEHYGLAGLRLEPVDGGADRAAQLWRATGPGSRGYAVKATRGGSASGLLLAAALDTARPGSTPAPLRTRAGALYVDLPGDTVATEPEVGPGAARGNRGLAEPASGASRAAIPEEPAFGARPVGTEEAQSGAPRAGGAQAVGRPPLRLSVAPWIEGPTAMDTGLDAGGWRAFGALLAALHALDPGDELRAALPRERFDAGYWAAEFLRVDAAADRPPADATAEHAAALWEKHRAALHTAHRTALAAAAELQGRAAEFASVPCHADPHLGNVLASQDGPVLIDFDDAVLAPPERDLMFVLGGGVLAGQPASAADQDHFASGYGTLRPDPRLLTYYRCLRTLEDAAELADAALDPDAADRAFALHHLSGLFSPTGLLAQAVPASHRSA
ncbi:phosphotransferase family protein [Nocardiopsis coralliicola]